MNKRLKTHCRLLGRAKWTINKSRLKFHMGLILTQDKSLFLAKEAEGKKSWSCKRPSSLPLSQFGKQGTTTSQPPGRILKEDEMLSKFYSKQLLIDLSTSSFPASPAFRANFSPSFCVPFPSTSPHTVPSAALSLAELQLSHLSSSEDSISLPWPLPITTLQSKVWWMIEGNFISKIFTRALKSESPIAEAH